VPGVHAEAGASGELTEWRGEPSGNGMRARSASDQRSRLHADNMIAKLVFAAKAYP